MKYDLHTAMREDIESGSVWISTPALTSRTVVRLRRTESGRAVHCEVKMIDGFFLKSYTERTGRAIADPSTAIFVSAWYRKQLGISETYGQIELDVSEADSVTGKICACLHHPQVVVRIATSLGILSVALGFIGLALGVISVLP